MPAWIEDELHRIGDAEELEIAPVHRDGSTASPMPITAQPRSGCCPGHDTPSTPKTAAS